MATYSNTAREVEMPNGDVVVIHNAPTGGENTTSNIKKFKYDDNGHVTESTAADAEDLNLSGYSTPTTGTTAIGTSDDIQTAIGKLDHQSHIDQTNILYGLNRNAKNLIDFKFNDTPTTGTGYYWDTACDLPAGTYSISFLLTSTAQVGLYVTVDGSDISKFLQTGTKVSHEYTFTANSAITRVRFWINGGENIIYDFMISLKDVYDADPTYESYSAPNYDLTYLESQDRAALAEEIDAGAKNKIYNESTTATIGNLVFTANGDGSVKVTGSISSSDTRAAYQYFRREYVVKSGDFLSGCPTGGGDTTYEIQAYDGTTANTLHDYGDGVDLTPLVGHTIEILIVIRPNINGSVNKTFYPMLCTKAAFCLSPKFVPYRPPYDQMIPHVYSSTTDLNNLLTTGVYRTSNLTSTQHAPENGYFTLIVMQIDTSTIQVAYRTNKPEIFYQRHYISNAWSSWYRFTDHCHEVGITQESQLDDFPAGTVSASPSVSVAGISSGTWMVIHTYNLNSGTGTSERRMQIIEAAGGVRKSRWKGTGGWGTWA